MRVTGWCTKCKRVKLVNVAAGSLVAVATGRSKTYEGICDACREGGK